MIAVISALLIAVGGAVSSGDLATETLIAKAQNPLGLPAGSVVSTIFDDLGFAWILGLVVLVAAAAAPSCGSADRTTMSDCNSSGSLQRCS